MAFAPLASIPVGSINSAPKLTARRDWRLHGQDFQTTSARFQPHLRDGTTGEHMPANSTQPRTRFASPMPGLHTNAIFSQGASKAAASMRPAVLTALFALS
jgi:hypothetical protein